MNSQWELEDVNSDQQDHGLPELSSPSTSDKAAGLGLSNTSIDNVLYDAFGQRDVSNIYEDVNQYHVVMEVDPKFGQDPTALHNIYVSSGRGAPPPTGGAAAAGQTAIGLATPAANATTLTTAQGQTSQGLVQRAQSPASPRSPRPTPPAPAGCRRAGRPNARPPARPQAGRGRSPVPARRPAVRPRPASPSPTRPSPGSRSRPSPSWADSSTRRPLGQDHQDTQPATTISFNLAAGQSLSDATAAIERAQASIGLPVTIHGHYAGNALAFQQLLGTLLPLIGAAIVAIYLVLGMLYESYIHPLTVLSTLPSAGVGAFIALIVFHIEFSLIAFIGIILLIGIVKKNAIMMIDFALVAERDEGLEPREAIRRAALTRFRPIMMTTFAAILGAVPLAVGWGEGAELRTPLGVTVIGGLLVSQVITLLTTPVVYLYLDGFRRREPRHSPGPGPAAHPLPAE